MKKLSKVLALTAVLSLLSPSANADSVTVESVPVVGSVDTPAGTINVWRADLPTRVWLEEGSNGKPCGDISFTIEALLPYSDLDQLNGPEVEFEIWSQDGTKIGSESIWRSKWNPIGPLNKVEIFNCKENGFGTFVLLVKTKYQVSTTGLISRYFENTLRQNITIEASPEVPSEPELREGKWTSGVLRFRYTVPNSDLAITHYEVGFSTSRSSAGSRNPRFGDLKVLKTIEATKSGFDITRADVKSTFTSRVNFVSVRVRAVSQAGTGEWSNGWYYSKSQVRAIRR